MGKPEDPVELALVRKAINESRRYTCGYCDWKEGAAKRVRERPPLEGMTPEGIRELLLEYVIDQQGEVIQVREARELYRDKHRFYYKALIPIDGASRSLFVEIVLIDDDPDEPAVLLVNAHL